MMVAQLYESTKVIELYTKMGDLYDIGVISQYSFGGYLFCFVLIPLENG